LEILLPKSDIMFEITPCFFEKNELNALKTTFLCFFFEKMCARIKKGDKFASWIVLSYSILFWFLWI